MTSNNDKLIEMVKYYYNNQNYWDKVLETPNFIIKHLAKKVYKNNYFKLTSFWNRTLWGDQDPVSILYSSFVSQLNKQHEKHRKG